MKIIVVDDEVAALSTFLYSIVDDVNIEYKLFLNEPMLAVEYATNKIIDAAFLDINMPQINGVALAEKLIVINPQIKIIFISGYSQDEQDIAKRIGNNLLGYCKKPYDADELINLLRQVEELSNEKREIIIRTFGGFDLFIGESIVQFASTKAKELLALLVDKKGASLEMGEAVAYLWPDKDAEHGKRLYRDAVFRLRVILKKNALLSLVRFDRARMAIIKQNVTCDLWEYLKDENNDYSNLYMSNYDWSIDTQTQLDTIKDARIKKNR